MKTPMKKHLYFLKRLYASPKEWRGFRKYLISPFDGKSEKHSEILDYLEPLLKEESKGGKVDIDDENLALMVFPGTEVSSRYSKVQLSHLMRHLNDFLAYQEFKRDKIVKEIYLLKAWNRRKWDSFYPGQHKKALKLLDEAEFKDARHYYHKMELYELFDDYLSRQKDEVSGLRYQEESSSLDHFYVINLLKMACNAVNHDSLFGTDHNLPVLNAVLEMVEDNFEEQEPLAKGYYYLYKMMTEPDGRSYYYHLKPLLLGLNKMISKSEVETLFRLATNYCIIQYNNFKDGSGPEKEYFQKEIIELYKFQLREKIFFRDVDGASYLDHGDYKNIITMYSTMGEYREAERFINEYHNKVLKDLHKASMDFGLGILYFEKGEYKLAKVSFKRVIDQLSGRNDQQLYLHAKRSFIKTLFELNDFDNCERVAYLFERSKAGHKNANSPFLKRHIQFAVYTKLLCKAVGYPPEKCEKHLGKLLQRIEVGPPAVSRTWILKKIEQFWK